MKRIDVLPDDVLLEIFDLYMIVYPYRDKTNTEAWQSLVHVCRRWRSLVLESPRRLNLRLYCTPDTPAGDKLDVWPALPLIVTGDRISSPMVGTDNVIAALEQSDRVCQVDLWLVSWELGDVLATMQVPFPELTELRLSSRGETPTVIRDSFLGGSAPHLRVFKLSGIPFPGLPKLLLSATHLVYFDLSDIPRSGYISPEAMIALLSALPSLETFSLEFQSLQSHPSLKRRNLPPPKRSILPSLRRLGFKGVIEYLEELVNLIDTPQGPQVDYMHITFFDQIDFDCPRLVQFINRTPTFGEPDKAYVQFRDWKTSVELLARSGTLDIGISWREPHRQLLSVAQVCNSSLHLPSTVEDLYIERRYWTRVWKIDAFENTHWLRLLLPFTAVKNLYLSEEFAPGIAAALQELVGSRITEVLPSLQNIFVEGLKPSKPFQENIEQFVTARQLSGHPVAISFWRKDR